MVLEWHKLLSVSSFHLLAAENDTTSYCTWLIFKVFTRYLLSSTSFSHISQSGYHSPKMTILIMLKLILNLEIRSSLLLAMCSYMCYTLEVSVYLLYNGGDKLHNKWFVFSGHIKSQRWSVLTQVFDLKTWKDSDYCKYYATPQWTRNKSVNVCSHLRKMIKLY